MTVSFREYLQEMQEFADRHNKNCGVKTYTSPLEHNRYHKEICWEDGATWYEVTENVIECVPVTVHNIECHAFVELWRTEFWNTDNSRSRYTYQRA